MFVKKGTPIFTFFIAQSSLMTKNLNNIVFLCHDVLDICRISVDFILKENINSEYISEWDFFQTKKWAPKPIH